MTTNPDQEWYDSIDLMMVFCSGGGSGSGARRRNDHGTFLGWERKHMKFTGVVLAAACVLALVGCGESPSPEITTKQEHELTEILPPSVNLSGSWTALWTDPIAGSSETFTLDLEQDGNELEGTALFEDASLTRAVVDGQISGDRIHLVMKPASASLHETSWTGTVSEGAVTGTWHLHGNPPRGMGTTGPWHGSMEQD